METMLKENSAMLSEALSMGRDQYLLFTAGIHGYRDRIISDYKARCPNPLPFDKTLGHPHKKILEYLSDKFDHPSGKFNEVNFSKIVKECRLGKNMAKGYLDTLVEKGYLCRRDDGYRVWYCVDNLEKTD